MGKNRPKRKVVAKPKQYKGPRFDIRAFAMLGTSDSFIVDLDNTPWIVTADGGLRRPTVYK